MDNEQLNDYMDDIWATVGKRADAAVLMSRDRKKGTRKLDR